MQISTIINVYDPTLYVDAYNENRCYTAAHALFYLLQSFFQILIH